MTESYKNPILFLDTFFKGYTHLEIEKESKKYNAMRFKFKNSNIIFRTANKTPTKVGQFVTLWKRNKNGITQPFDETDNFNYVIISVTDKTNSGYFMFSKAELIKQKIISSNKFEGKRGMRVYAPWHKTENKQAIKTQQWQVLYIHQL